mmetsp:Transcript_13564/g.50495  ORF Transcript_13564/g.50495 Transcript_13564/m.50495 type:complete len:294 (+) Transcript_13564:254-1135(+)
MDQRISYGHRVYAGHSHRHLHAHVNGSLTGTFWRTAEIEATSRLAEAPTHSTHCSLSHTGRSVYPVSTPGSSNGLEKCARARRSFLPRSRRRLRAARSSPRSVPPLYSTHSVMSTGTYSPSRQATSAGCMQKMSVAAMTPGQQSAAPPGFMSQSQPPHTPQPPSQQTVSSALVMPSSHNSPAKDGAAEGASLMSTASRSAMVKSSKAKRSRMPSELVKTTEVKGKLMSTKPKYKTPPLGPSTSCGIWTVQLVPSSWTAVKVRMPCTSPMSTPKKPKAAIGSVKLIVKSSSVLK